MDYYTYNSSKKVQQHVATQQRVKTSKQQKQVRSSYVANMLLAASKQVSK
jgi:hypothetical protein